LIPETLLGLILFAAAVGPGYAFIRVHEGYEHRPERSLLFEAAELLVIGALITTAVAMVVLVLGKETDVLDTAAIGEDPTAYILAHPFRGLGALLLIFTLSPLAGHFLAEGLHSGEVPSIRPESVWASVLGPDKGAKVAWVTAELRDGRAFFGQVQSYTLDPELSSREISLWKPIQERIGPRERPAWRLLSDDALILPAKDVSTLSVKYRDPPR
jgi:uncharacterized protein DUF6338